MAAPSSDAAGGGRGCLLPPEYDGEDDDGAPPVPETGVAGEQVGEDKNAPQAERPEGEGGQGALHGECVLLFLNARILRREM